MTNQFSNCQLILGYLFALAATALWSGNFIITRGLNESIPRIGPAFWRWIVAVCVILPFASKPLLAEWKVLRANFGYLAITSLLGVTLFRGLLAYFILHEAMGMFHLYSALLTICGILTANYMGSKLKEGSWPSSQKRVARLATCCQALISDDSPVRRPVHRPGVSLQGVDMRLTH